MSTITEGVVKAFFEACGAGTGAWNGEIPPDGSAIAG